MPSTVEKFVHKGWVVAVPCGDGDYGLARYRRGSAEVELGHSFTTVYESKKDALREAAEENKIHSPEFRRVVKFVEVHVK